MGKRGHVPLRTCIGCQQVWPKRELLRFVRHGEDGVVVDPEAKLEGRGTYTCYRLECFGTAIKKRRFEKVLGVGLSPEVIEIVTQLLRKIK